MGGWHGTGSGGTALGQGALATGAVGPLRQPAVAHSTRPAQPVTPPPAPPPTHKMPSLPWRPSSQRQRSARKAVHGHPAPLPPPIICIAPAWPPCTPDVCTDSRSAQAFICACMHAPGTRLSARPQPVGPVPRPTPYAHLVRALLAGAATPPPGTRPCTSGLTWRGGTRATWWRRFWASWPSPNTKVGQRVALRVQLHAMVKAICTK